MKPFEKHIFVCINERPLGHPRGDCSSKGGQAMIDALKATVMEKCPTMKIRVNKSGCLDQCERGCAMVIYPEATWYYGVGPQDSADIIGAMLEGKTVERLKSD